jgi:hypothetical protein
MTFDFCEWHKSCLECDLCMGRLCDDITMGDSPCVCTVVCLAGDSSRSLVCAEMWVGLHVKCPLFLYDFK